MIFNNEKTLLITKILSETSTNWDIEKSKVCNNFGTKGVLFWWWKIGKGTILNNQI